MQEMTREGVIKISAATGEKEHVSRWIGDTNFIRTEALQQPEQAAQIIPDSITPMPTADAPPLPHAPEVEWEQDTTAVERILEHINGARTRKVNKKATRKAQAETAAKEKSSRLQFIDGEQATSGLEGYIRKPDKATDRLDAARMTIPKEKEPVQERIFNGAIGKSETRLRFEEQEKPIGKNKPHNNSLSRSAREADIFVYDKIHSVEKDNSGVEGAHKFEKLTERGAKHETWKVKEDHRSHKLKPYRAATEVEKAVFKMNMDLQCHKALRGNPQIADGPLPRFMQRQQIERRYAKAARKGGAKTAQKVAENTCKVAKKVAEGTKRTIVSAGRHPAGVCITVVTLFLFIMISAGLSSCGSMFPGLMSGIFGASYTSEDSNLVATKNNYAAKENEPQRQIGNIESTHPGYDEYRHDFDSIGYDPYESASYLTALLQTYTPQSTQAELSHVFTMQYTLTPTRETRIHYRTETSIDSETGETTIEEVPCEYHILSVRLTNRPISEITGEPLTPQRLEVYRVCLETSRSRPLIFGGDSPDMGTSEDLSGVQLANGTRPGNTAVINFAKRQVNSMDGRPYWNWCGLGSRVR